jgi:hypothetical protein
VGKCEGKKSWRGLVAKMEVLLQGRILFYWLVVLNSKQGGKYLGCQADLDFHRK